MSDNSLKGLLTKKLSAKLLIIPAISALITMLVMEDRKSAYDDFWGAKKALVQTRNASMTDGKKRIAKFIGKKLIIYESDEIIYENEFETLANVNYNTTLGDNMIVYNGHGTNPFNKKVHGGDITFKSWLGFTKSIWVNCTGYAVEGTMIEE